MPRFSGEHSDSDSALSFDVDLSSPAVAFATLYAIMLVYTFRMAMRNPTSVLIVLSLFCAIQVAEFAIRSTVEDSDDAELGLFVAMGVLDEVGLSALLYSAYTLVLDRGIVSGNAVKNSISRVTSKRPFIWFLLGLAAATAIAAGVSSAIFFENGIYPDPGFPLQAASVGIFLLTTVMLAVQTGFQLRAERAALKRSLSSEARSEKSRGMYIPSSIVILLLIRGIYRTVSISLAAAESKALWYSLAAAPELLAVFLFAVTGLVPEKKELVPRTHEDGKDREVTRSG